MCNKGECSVKSAAPAKIRPPVIAYNRRPAVIQNTSGPKPVLLKSKNHDLFIVNGGHVTACSGTVVIMMGGKVNANSGSTVIVYPGVKIGKVHEKAVILSPGVQVDD